VRTDETAQSGFQVSGWKSLMDRQSFEFVLNRPFGVHIMMPGGLNGYSGGTARAGKRRKGRLQP
jgi:hypothetical protein